jgi:hypothetical protein
MERSSVPAALFITIGLIVAGYFIGNTVLKARKFERSVQVKGLAEREVAADLAVWPLQISLAGNDLSSLKENIEAQKATVHAFFLDQGFTEDDLIAGLTNIQDLKADAYRNQSQYLEFRYIANTDFTIRTTDIEKLREALSESLELISEGIVIDSKDNWRPIQYSFTRLNEIKPAMVEEATKNAREVAEKFAQDSGSKVGKIKSARQGVFSITDLDTSTPEIKKVRVVSTIEYFLQD